jgi:hypothetical protein
MRYTATGILVSLVLLLSGTGSAWAVKGGVLDGTPPTTSVPSNQEVIYHAFPGACLDCFTGGVKLRNAPPSPPSAEGTITVPATAAANAVFAHLFWVILDDVTPPATETFNGVSLERESCGPVTGDPCWPTLFAYAYHADVLGLLVAGDNTVSLPDAGPPIGGAPNAEGATLVVVYSTSTADKEIIITCGNDLFEASGFAVDLALPVATAPGIGAELTFIVGDGQEIFDDEAYWNGTALDEGNAFQGLDPGPGTTDGGGGYWDTLQFTVFTGPPSTAGIVTGSDCLNWISTVFCTKTGPCRATPTEPSTWGRIKSQYKDR